jgi:hypothetical protein
MQDPALARAHMHFVRVNGGPHIDEIVHYYSSLLYMLAIDDMANHYSRLSTILLFLL